ncbi:septal ring lytic transglycosylase RlpA family protein [Halomonas marinisediminis]|uniref:Endolytic peptidoglycan transglycosylase RlpA n=1 Tax=Halomonas marinisediminis TaxID=2546095 RepID=A0ABY2DAZ4_9GAMM|nr:septal ring lytic transglycosylase RlpA family protein [Halomonas marinisediminis]TDB05218.1 septal ring lytic transglycosylase RlpA family protein [Halomonas marinisediminis]
MRLRWLGIALAATLVGCAGGGGAKPGGSGQADTISQVGRYAMSGDAYPEEPPDVSRVADAQPRHEPRSRGGNRPTYQVWGKTYHVLPDASGYVKQGTASWYGKKFHGYATSNGEIYDMYKMSAAHRSLPLPTFARVTSLDNGRSVIVRVNDRGPFHSDREIDLSYAAAARLDILDNGTGRVRVEAIDVDRWLAENGSGRAGESGTVERQDVVQAGTSPTAPVSDQTPVTRAQAPEGRPLESSSLDGDGRTTERPLYLQVAALGSASNARALRARLERELTQPVRVAGGSGVHRVQVGPITRAAQLEPLRQALRRAGFGDSFIVKGAE